MKSLEECEVMGYEPDFNNPTILQQHRDSLCRYKNEITTLTKTDETTLEIEKTELITKLQRFRSFTEHDFNCYEHPVLSEEKVALMICDCKRKPFAMALAISFEETIQHFKVRYQLNPIVSNDEYDEVIQWWQLMTGWNYRYGHVIKCCFNGRGYSFHSESTFNNVKCLIGKHGGDMNIK